MAQDANTQMARLAGTFPCMKGKAGVLERIPAWDANRIDSWAASGGARHGQRVTAQFLLSVWNPEETWKCGVFNLMEALRVWDEPHHKAFLAWASNPWWP